MKHTTHKLTNEQKEALFDKHKDLISLVHTLGDMVLRKQLKVLSACYTQMQILQMLNFHC